MSDLHITPKGHLRDDAGTFADGNGPGLLTLVRLHVSTSCLAARYFHRLFIDYLRALSAQPNLDHDTMPFAFKAVRPDVSELSFVALSAPPFVGGEYFDGWLLHHFYIEFEAALKDAFAKFKGTFAEFLRTISPAWKDVGKVSFHLAENKNDTTGHFPFAFMASFIHRAEDDRPKHLPLSVALRLFATNPAALQAVLSPIEHAAEKSAFLRTQLEDRRLFQPSAWDSREAYQFLRDIGIYEAANIVVRVANLWKTAAPPQAKVSVKLDVGKRPTLDARTLLDFSAEVTLGDEVLTEEEVQELLRSQGGLIRIKGQWVIADPEKIEALLAKWREAQQLVFAEGISLVQGLRFLSGVDVLDGDKGAAGGGGDDGESCRIEATGKLREYLKDLLNPTQINDVPDLPAGLGDVLRPYQRDGVKYLWRTCSMGLGACLADDMGLGKTLQMLTLLMMWKQAGTLKKLPALLVVPATLLTNWQNESARFTPDLRLTILHASSMGKDEFAAFEKNPTAYLLRYDLAIVTYGMVARLPQLAELEFPAVITDEAQTIKNPDARQSKAVRGLRGRNRIALTGTPVENRLTDLWSIFDFINPGLLGGLKPFITFTKALNDDYAPLRKLTQPFILRRLKTDKRIISDLPDKTELKVYCNLSKHQVALYAQNVAQMEKELDAAEENFARNGIVLKFLMRFKQICNHPAHYLGDGNYAEADSGKYRQIETLIETISARQEKVLVFTQFREMTEPIHELLTKYFGRPGLILHGGTPVKQRQNLVNQFQSEDGPPFFVLSLKAGGTGLNLTAANHVIHFDRWWNPAVENQASDRAFRIGQKRNVLVHKFICKGTLEEKIDELITSKQDLADSVLTAGTEKLLTAMNNEELMSFVKLDMKQMEDMSSK